VPSFIKAIGVVGAGLMGHGIAQVFASNGYRVILVDISEEQLNKAMRAIKDNLQYLKNCGLGPKESIEEVLSRMDPTTSWEPLGGADFVVECVFEDLRLKQEVFKKLDQLCGPEAIFASNTSVISISQIAEKAKRKERILGTHFWNPPYLIPLVEVVKARDTSDEVFEFTYEFLRKIGKKTR